MRRAFDARSAHSGRSESSGGANFADWISSVSDNRAGGILSGDGILHTIEGDCRSGKRDRADDRPPNRQVSPGPPLPPLWETTSMIRKLAWSGALACSLVSGPFAASAQETATPAPSAPASGEARIDIESMARRSQAHGGGGGGSDSHFRDFDEVTQGADRLEGLFTLFHKDSHLYAEIRPHQFDTPLIAPIAIARGMAMAGQPLNFGDEWVLSFRRVGDRVQLVRRNIHYKASTEPLEKAVKQAYTDSILQSLPIVSIRPMGGGQSALVDLSDVFLNDFAELGIGPIDRSRTSWHKIKAFPNNLELEVEATYGGGFGGYGDDGVADHRGVTLIVHYSLVKPPDAAYHPRLADDRVGHFLSAVKDFSQSDPDTSFVRQVNRWRLEKSNHKAKVSAPKRQIVWYIEDTVPLEYRSYVQEGILEWNKAFEKIGFRDAIAVRWQEEGRDDFDPEDINYCTFRWITSNSTFAMSGLRSNPITGELIDGDVVFDASWIKEWKQEYAFLTGNPPASSRQAGGRSEPLGVGRILSPIMAMKQGYGLAVPPPSAELGDVAANLGERAPRLIPAEGGELQALLGQRLGHSQFSGCRLSSGMRAELSLAAIALSADEPKVAVAPEEAKKPVDEAKKPEDKPKDEAKKDEPKKPEDKPTSKKEKEKEESRLPDELIGQGIKEVVMHEVGHSLGLRHNFKASTMLSGDQLHDTAITHVKGLVGSVMDYAPINVAPKGRPQGDYFSTTLGPYDYWAIEYAYKPIDGDEAGELKKIASRAPESDLAYGTDEDMYQTHDPLVNTYDLGSDTLRFAQDRALLASQLLGDLDGRVVKDGESWGRLRHAFGILMQQWGNGTYLVSEYVGGQHVHRDHKGDKDGRDPIVPVSGAKQREALRFLVTEVLGDKAFHFSPGLLRKLTTERWYHWGSDSPNSATGVEYPVLDEVLGIQKIALNRCLGSSVLARLQEQSLEADEGAQPLTMAEVFRALTDGVWSECPSGDGPPTVTCSTIRRNLQREHLRKLGTMVLGTRRNSMSDIYSFLVMVGGSGNLPPDARSLARLHLKEIGDRVGKALDRKDAHLDDLTRAHLEECRQRVDQILTAKLDANEP